MGRVGVSLDNRPIEYFFSILKQEWLIDIPAKERSQSRIKREIENFVGLLS